MFVNEDDNQLRAAHLIQGYTPISRAFQVPKCVIKARDPCLQKINVAVEGFLLLKGASLPEGIPLVGSFSSHPVVEVFNRAQSFEDPFGDLGNPNCTDADFPFSETPFKEDMGIQRK